MRILVLNPGSSSMKYQVWQVPASEPGKGVLFKGLIDGPHEGLPGLRTVGAELDRISAVIRDSLGGLDIDAIGHRVVHGGARFSAPVIITLQVIQAIEELGTLAPLHNPVSAACIRAAAARWPDTPQVAVFDTAFHRTLPEHASRYAVPEELHRKYGIRRYGFHGISVEMVCRDTATLLGIPASSLNAIVAHLGSGASVTAVRNGRSADTSMGMTPLEGLVMGTRSGDLDPSIVILLQRRGLSLDAVEDLLNHRSGLLGLTGSSDMRTVQDAEHRGEPQAVLALDIAAYRLAKYIGAYSIVVGGTDAMIFTGGVGEHSASFRSRILSHLGPLGLLIDEDRNRADVADIRTISSAGSAFPVLVVPSDEERAIAEATATLLRVDDPGN